MWRTDLINASLMLAMGIVLIVGAIRLVWKAFTSNLRIGGERWR